MLYTRRRILQAALELLGSASLVVSLKGDAGQGEPSEAALQLILVKTREEAEQIRMLLNAGESFGWLAAMHSVDTSGQDLGYLGSTSLPELRPKIRNALKGLGPGQVTAPVQTASGYMIFRILSKSANLDFENAQRSERLATEAIAQVRLVTRGSGLTWADYFFLPPIRPPGWTQDLESICQSKRQAVDFGMRGIQDYLAKAEMQKSSEINPTSLVNLEDALAALWAYQGNMKKAIEHFQAESEMVASTAGKDAKRILEEKLGVAHLRQAELDNSVKGVQVNNCLFPMGADARYKEGSNAEIAVKHFRKCLKLDPKDLEVKWLLNLAYMNLGRYPDGVPKQHLIPLAPFESKEDIGRFEDVAPSIGLNTFGTAGGIVIDDFDNDGFLDVVTSSSGSCEHIHYFHNNGDGTFTDRTVEAGLSDQLGGFNLLQADYDNDGWLDILVLRGAWERPMRRSLLRNNRDGTFTDVTRESGLAVPATSTQTAAWADFDNDGNLDLFVGNEFSPSQLFRNKGDGTFEDVGPIAGIDRTRFTKGVTAGDYDNDGYPDFYVSNLHGENFLYHNNRNGTFTDVARELRVELPLISFPVWFWDYNNDGWLDLFVSSYYASVTEVIASYLGLPVHAESAKLYRNTGKGTFEDVTKRVGLDRVFMPMGANFGDIDNDGFLDFYLGTGAPSYGALVPNVLLRNHDGEYFTDITASSGTGCLHKGHGVAFADINNDGLVELLVKVGGMVPGDKYLTLVFRNPGNTNHWINIRLIGVKTNRAAIGARIKITLETEGQRRREVHRVVGSGGTFGASPLQQHIGLGEAKRIVALEIWWPTSNTRQVFRNVYLNQFIEVREFAMKFTRVGRRSFELGTRNST